MALLRCALLLVIAAACGSNSIRGRVFNRTGVHVYASREGPSHNAEISADGSFVVRGVAGGAYELTAWDPIGYEHVTVKGVGAGAKDVELRFPPGGTLELRCFDEFGHRLRSIHVTLWADERPVRDWPIMATIIEFWPSRGETLDDARGRFRVALPVGRFIALVSNQRTFKRFGVFDVEIRMGEVTRVDSRSDALPEIVVEVRDTESAPIHDCPVEFASETMAQLVALPPGRRGTWTGPDGGSGKRYDAGPRTRPLTGQHHV
ncbi:MAG: carboxypeptidase-like regulatory domain-containing protein [Planctomycetota bacterium]|jgi:hypothetical protein